MAYFLLYYMDENNTIYMKRHTKILFALMAFGISIPSSLLAADFNKNMIISDEEMQAWETMDRADIQAFLEDKDSYLSTYRTDDWEGTKRVAADIIYQAAKDNRINPKYLLVKLQKEQSLITNDDPTQKQLDWATGYGVCDSCKTTDPDIQKYKGFGTQVDRAAGIMRWYYENMSSESWIKRAGRSYTIDGETVRPQSNATGFLYSYTPHIHGNENFWKLWQAWFQQVYPDSTLMQATGDKNIYLIKDGKKRKFKNMTSLVTRYNPDMIVSVSPAELLQYPDGPEISLPNYAIVKNGSSYYLLDYDYKRKFASYEVVKNLGYHPDEIIDVSNADLNGYLAGPTIGNANENPLGRVVKVQENGSLYYILDGVYHAIYDESVARLNFAHLSIDTVSATELHGLDRGDPILPKDGSIFGITGNPKIYVVENGKKRHIATASVFEDFGYNWDNIIWVGQATGEKLEMGQSLYEKPSTDVTEISPDTTDEITEDVSEETIDPVDYMVRTPSSELAYIGPTFDTNIDGYLVADYETGEIIAGKNVDTVRPMASLTKVMTAYQLLLDGINLSGNVTYDPSIHRSSYHRFRIVEDETYRIKDLLNASLVSSLNTPTRMLVNRDGRQDTEFVQRMNTTVQNMGLNNTVFTDTYGFDETNVTTLREYLTLFSKVVKNTTVRSYLSKTSYSYTELTDKDGKPSHHDVHSNDLVGKSGLPYTILASKTGFLYDAGTCLAMLVERHSDGKQFIILTMGNDEFGSNTRFNSPEQLADWAMDEF